MADDSKVDEDEAEPLSSRDVELEPVSLRDIEMILAPGKAPPLLSKPETLADKMKRLEAARAKSAAGPGPDAPTRPDTPALLKADEKKERKAPALPPRKADAKPPLDLDQALERAKAPLPPPQPKDSGLEDLRQLAASHPPPKKADAVDFDAVLRDDEAPPPPPPLPPDLSALTGESKAKPAPKAPLKKRDAKKEPADDAVPPGSERPPRSAPGSKRPAARSERPRTTGVPAKSIEPARPSTSSVRPAKGAPAVAASSGSGRMILVALGGIALLGVGYLLGKSNEPPAPVPPGPAATVTVTVTVPAPVPEPKETAAGVPTAEPTASESAPPVSTTTSTALPTALTGAVASTVGTATSKPTAAPGGGEFDKAAANAALSGAVGQAAACKKEGDPSGRAQVSVTFAPSGRVTIANVTGPPFAGTATGGCIAKAFRSASVAPFSGDAVTVSKTVNIP